MALALRLFLLLLLAVALPARAAQAAPLQVRGADERARTVSPAAQLHEDLQPLKPPAGVSAGRTFQAPFLVAAHKPSSHRREMEREAVLKAQFPRGSRGSLAASAAGREAMPGTVPGDEHPKKVSPAAWLHEDLQPLKPPAGVSPGRTFHAPFLVPAHKPGYNRRGPPRGRNKLTGDFKSLEASKHTERIVSALERRREMEGEAVLKAQFPGGRRGSLAASAAGRETKSGTVPGDWDPDFQHFETLVKHAVRILELGGAEPDDEDDSYHKDFPVDDDVLDSQPIAITEPLGDGQDAAGTSTHAGVWRRVFCWETPCLIKFIVILAGAALCLLICCAAICYCWKRKECSCESSEEEPNNSGRENFPRDPSCPLLPLSALPSLQHCHKPFPKPTPPKRDPLPLSPLVLYPGTD